jgi:hypothetical protein
MKNPAVKFAFRSFMFCGLLSLFGSIQLCGQGKNLEVDVYYSTYRDGSIINVKRPQPGEKLQLGEVKMIVELIC